MDERPLRHGILEPSMFLYVVKHWPGLAAVAGIFLGGYGFLAGYGFIDGIVHVAEFNIFKAHVEDRHEELKETVSEVRGDVKQLLHEQIKLGRAVERIEAKGLRAPIVQP